MVKVVDPPPYSQYFLNVDWSINQLYLKACTNLFYKIKNVEMIVEKEIQLVTLFNPA